MSKHQFEFGQSNGLAADMRQAKALEFIAYYLNRIDDHLAIIAKAAAPDRIDTRLTDSLKEIAVAIRGVR